MTDADKAAKMTRLCAGLASVDLNSADGRAGISALLREIEDAAPGSLERMVSSLQLRKLGLATPEGRA